MPKRGRCNLLKLDAEVPGKVTEVSKLSKSVSTLQLSLCCPGLNCKRLSRPRYGTHVALHNPEKTAVLFHLDGRGVSHHSASLSRNQRRVYEHD